MTVNFNQKLNVIIGANGNHKTALIDAIRLFYSWSDRSSDIDITQEDFNVEETVENNNKVVNHSKTIKIIYKFEELTSQQQGAFHQYIVANENGQIYARVEITYELKENGRIISSYCTGKRESNIKADWNTFQYFKAYYLGALRDSTKDLLRTRNNLLGKVIKRKIDKNESEETIKNIIRKANLELLERDEVKKTKEGINKNLVQINKINPINVDLHIEQNRIDYIVNVIKPYLPFSNDIENEGFLLSQNSLGFNNLIYIATVLSDIKDCHEDDPISIYSLLIEEPEAHLHPQLQVNLYNFLKDADLNKNSQMFITTHSPTLTSRIPLENLLLLNENTSYLIGECFKNREDECLISDYSKNKKITKSEVIKYRRMVSRYLDITRSQLFFSNGCLFIEGISESQMINTFSKIMGKCLVDNQIEIININGTAFYQFIMLFNSSEPTKRLPIKAAFLTDEDQFTDSKNTKYKIENLLENNNQLLEELRKNIYASKINNRVNNMIAMSNKQKNIKISSGLKTLEYQICLANVPRTIKEIKGNCLYQFLNDINEEALKYVDKYLTTLKEEEEFSVDEQRNIAILLWKCMPTKAVFAQEFNDFLLNKMVHTSDIKFIVPKYIQDAINHLIK